EDDGEQTEGGGDGARHVEPTGVPLRLRQHARGHGRRYQADRHVEEEGQPPSGGVVAEDGEVGAGEPAAQQQTDGATDSRDRGVHGEGTAAGRTGGEGGGDERQGSGTGHGGAQALEPAG